MIAFEEHQECDVDQDQPEFFNFAPRTRADNNYSRRDCPIIGILCQLQSNSPVLFRTFTSEPNLLFTLSMGHHGKNGKYFPKDQLSSPPYSNEIAAEILGTKKFWANYQT